MLTVAYNHSIKAVLYQTSQKSQAMDFTSDSKAPEAPHGDHSSTPIDNNERKAAAGPVIVCTTKWLQAQLSDHEPVNGPETYTPKEILTGGKATHNMELDTGPPRDWSQDLCGNRSQIWLWPVMEFGDSAKSFHMKYFMYRSFLREVPEVDRELANKRRPLPAVPDRATEKQDTWIFGSCFPEILDLMIRPEVLLYQHEISHQTSKRSAGQKQVTQTFDHEWIIIYREVWNRRCVDRYTALSDIVGPDMIDKDWQRGHFYRYEQFEPAKRGTQEVHVPAEFLVDQGDAIVRMQNSLASGVVRSQEQKNLLAGRYYHIMRSFYIAPALTTEGLPWARGSTTQAHVHSWGA